ncbi:adenosylcobinamide-phosphate synthase CbiB [Desulfitobacterium sp. AusDCA]|uniref:adenosylcobinamide-phosphate synthase CbiB n=1 Tax=Desulfitobacterium sp. AusDCA TaxID=3240383 RepID=UPI003DA6F4EE
MIISSAGSYLWGFILDQIIGDPRGWPHPVVGMGKLIAWGEKYWNCGTSRLRKLRGAFLAILVISFSFLLTADLIRGGAYVHPWLGRALEVVLFASTLAGKSLLDAGKTVSTPLRQGNLSEARQKLGWFVSRDTSNLAEAEIVRGAVETLAENFVDGILSPLFFMAVGGVPLAMAFKAVSTLDSMIGYRNERYQDFGWFAARTDDWANYIPARLAVGFLLFAGWLKKLPVRHAYLIWKRDAKAHPSPNGGNPESIVAGLLGVRLGGINIYDGEIHHRAEMGDPLHELTWRDIVACEGLIRWATWLSFIFFWLLIFITRETC